MSPSLWVAIALLAVGVSWLAGVCIEIANGNREERKAYQAKRAQDDKEAILQGEK